MNDRLRAIEEELNKLHNPDEIEVYLSLRAGFPQALKIMENLENH